MYYYVYQETITRHWRWTLFASNGRKIANSGEGYVNKADCITAINLVAGSDGSPIRYA